MYEYTHLFRKEKELSQYRIDIISNQINIKIKT